MAISPEARAQLAPSGRLRVGLNTANFLLVLADAPHGAPQGIAPDLARELAARAGLPLEFTRFDHPAKLSDAVRDAACDIGFLAADPQRAADIAFTAAYLEIDAGYLAAPGAPIARIEEVDRPGVRIAVAERTAYEMWLKRNIRHASLVGAANLDASYELFLRDKLDVLAGLKQGLIASAARFPGARLLEGRFMGVQQAIGTAKNRPAAAAFLAAFVEDAKASGLVARTIAKHAIKGVSVPEAAQ